MKKLLISLGVVALSCAAIAGLDTYTGINYVSVLDPVGWSNTGTASNITSTTDGANMIGLKGKAALVVSLSTGNGAGTIEADFYSCTTSNGTYSVLTNAGVACSVVITNGSKRTVVPITPGVQAAYWRCIATPSAAGTGQCASAVCVSY